MTHRPTIRRLAALLLTITAALALAGLAATAALADDGGMAGMPGMTDEEMQAMGQPTPAPAATPAGDQAMSGGYAMDSTDGSAMDSAQTSTHTGDLAPAMPQGMDMGGGTVNWIVIGAFLAIVAGSTVAAVAMKRRLRARMAAGELATAGVQNV